MIKNILLIFGVLLLVNACKITNDEDKVVEIDPIFSIDLRQDLSQIGGLNIIVHSTELQTCENYSISTEFNRTPSAIDLDLIEITPPQDCITGAEFAEAIVELGSIGTNRTYQLKISLQDAIENKGKLIINNKSYLIEMESLDGVSFVREELLKIPANTIWGFVAYNSELEVGNTPDEFLNDIQNLGDELILEEGYYGYFNFNSTNKISVIKSPSFQDIRTFILSYDDSLEDLEFLVNNYKVGTNPNEILMKVYTWNGEEY